MGAGRTFGTREGRRFWPVPALLLLAFVLASCAPGHNVVQSAADKHGHVAGFWLGLWQGIIAPITFFVSLFSHNVNVYEVHNNGNWYNFGFVLGAGILLGGGGIVGRRRRRG
jgi:LPXTG-motif cell wall-anchored protein